MTNKQIMKEEKQFEKFTQRVMKRYEDELKALRKGGESNGMLIHGGLKTSLLDLLLNENLILLKLNNNFACNED